MRQAREHRQLDDVVRAGEAHVDDRRAVAGDVERALRRVLGGRRDDRLVGELAAVHAPGSRRPGRPCSTARTSSAMLNACVGAHALARARAGSRACRRSRRARRSPWRAAPSRARRARGRRSTTRSPEPDLRLLDRVQRGGEHLDERALLVAHRVGQLVARARPSCGRTSRTRRSSSRRARPRGRSGGCRSARSRPTRSTGSG